MPRILTTPPSSPLLRPFVHTLWYFEGYELPHARERILPTGTMQLIVNLAEDEVRTYHGAGYAQVQRLRGAVLSGAYAKPFGIDTAEQRWVVGAHFHPGGAAPFLAEPSDALREDHVELDALWGREGAVLRERLLEAPSPEAALRRLEGVLLARAVRPLAVSEPVAFALARLERGAPVAEVTDRLGMTPRRFIQRFRETVGLTPKRYARVRRFGHVLEAIELGRPIDWSRVAADCGYFDQAHLIHDFQEFSGMNPTSYRPRAAGDRNHALIDA